MDANIIAEILVGLVALKWPGAILATLVYLATLVVGNAKEAKEASKDVKDMFK